jgi:hypothetical protein
VKCVGNVYTTKCRNGTSSIIRFDDYSFVTDAVGGDLTEECFYAERHKQIYKAIVDLSFENKPYDLFCLEKLKLERCFGIVRWRRISSQDNG